MANIGATTAFYKVETSLTKANQEVSKSMERLATGKQNANAGDRSSYVAMADTFRLDYVGTKAGIKGASVVMGYLETGMRVLDSASSLLSRMQELAVLGANATNTTADHEAINLEAEALADEFNRLMSSATYKGKPVFVSSAGSEYVSLGGRDAEMTFGIGTIDYSALYLSDSNARTIVGAPNNAATINLAHLPSDAAVPKAYGSAASSITETETNAGTTRMDVSSTYVIKGTIGTDIDLGESNTGGGSDDEGAKVLGAALATSAPGGGEVRITDYDDSDGVPTEIGASASLATTAVDLGLGDIIETGTGTLPDLDTSGTTKTANTYAKVRTDDNKFVAGETYVIYSLGDSDGNTATAGKDAFYLQKASSDITASSTLTVGQSFTIDSDANDVEMAHINSLIENMTFTKASNTLTSDIEAIQALVNGARVEAGSQYAALESAVQYTTDLTAQYELGYNTVNDVNFSMETAHLAKNQILQQAATAMLAQANQGQQGLLQLIQR
jgi:flagellin